MQWIKRCRVCISWAFIYVTYLHIYVYMLYYFYSCCTLTNKYLHRFYIEPASCALCHLRQQQHNENKVTGYTTLAMWCRVAWDETKQAEQIASQVTHGFLSFPFYQSRVELNWHFRTKCAPAFLVDSHAQRESFGVANGDVKCDANQQIPISTCPKLILSTDVAVQSDSAKINKSRTFGTVPRIRIDQLHTN